MRDRSVKDLLVGFTLIESKMNKGAYPSPALGRSEDQRIVDGVRDRVDRHRVGCGRIAAQEGHEIPCRSQTNARHCRVLCGVDQFVDVIGVEAAIQADLGRIGLARERHAVAVGKSPLAVVDRLACIGLAHAPRQNGARIVEARGLIGRPRSDIDRRARCCEMPSPSLSLMSSAAEPLGTGNRPRASPA